MREMKLNIIETKTLYPFAPKEHSKPSVTQNEYSADLKKGKYEFPRIKLLIKKISTNYIDAKIMFGIQKPFCQRFFYSSKLTFEFIGMEESSSYVFEIK